MRSILLGVLTVMFIWEGALCHAQTQGEICRLLTPQEAWRFLPDRVPMEAETIAVDTKNYVALQFPDKTRIAVAALVGSGLSNEMRQKYQYVFVFETRLKLDQWNLPAGMCGVSILPDKSQDAQTRTMVVRDFLGAEVERLVLKLDPSAPDVALSLTPTGANSFELRMGKYLISGKQR